VGFANRTVTTLVMMLSLASGACGGAGTSCGCGTTDPGPDKAAGDTVTLPDETPRDPGVPDEGVPDAPADARPPDDAKPDDNTPDVPGETTPDLPEPPPCPTVGHPEVRGTLAFADLAEVSGLAASRTHPGILWAHNDSGDTARFFAVDGATGETTATFSMTGIQAIDFEDIALGPFAGIDGDALFLADVGDNGALEGNGRDTVVLHVVAEPDPASNGPAEAPVPASLSLSYPDGPVDCEAVFVDPRNGDLYLVAKESFGAAAVARVYRKAAPHDPDAGTAMLEAVAQVPAPIATGADIRADGAVIVVRTYIGGVLYRRGDGQTIADAMATVPCELPSPMMSWDDVQAEGQGEAIALLPGGSGYVTVSEGRPNDPASQQLHFWPLVSPR
jgi:hypothetical protein